MNNDLCLLSNSEYFIVMMYELCSHEVVRLRCVFGLINTGAGDVRCSLGKLFCV